MGELIPRVILFDWDGTLIDPRYALWDIMNRTLLDMGRETIAYCENAEVPHFSRSVYLEKLFGEDAEKANKVFVRNMNSSDISKIRLHDGVREVLSLLKKHNHPLGVVSNKVGNALRREIDFFDLTEYFNVIVGSGDTSEDKPSPIPVRYALSCLGVSPCIRDIVLVGDSITDLQSASRSGIGFIKYGERKIEGVDVETSVSDHMSLLKIFGYTSD